MSTDYRKSHLGPGKGRSYDDQFYENPYRSMVWGLEQRVLGRIMQRFYKGRKIRHLDFACGTGRILGYFENHAEISVGVDLSESMLEVAREKLKRSEIINADISQNDVLGDRKFNLITAFRFFPNAQPQLRVEVMQRLIKHMDTDSYIVFNNHKNLSSSTNRLSRLLRRGGSDGMHHSEVESLLKASGLKIEKIYHIGVIPSTEKHLLLPQTVLCILEKALCACGIFRNLAQDLIFVCKRTG